jgi:hypothetical protein
MEAVIEAMKNEGRTNDGLNEVLPFVGLPNKKSSQELPGNTNDLFRQIIALINELLLRTIVKPTAQEFDAERTKVFSDVRKVVRAMSNIARVTIPRSTINRLAWESFEEMEAELTEHGLKHFGQTARDQAIFTIWTFRRISRLQKKIAEAAPLRTDEEQEKDRELAMQFTFYADWAQFHLECLFAAMRARKSIQPEVLGEVCEGLRAAVNAYGFISQGINIRSLSDTKDITLPAEWTPTDEVLLQQSMDDMMEMDAGEW